MRPDRSGCDVDSRSALVARCRHSRRQARCPLPAGGAVARSDGSELFGVGRWDLGRCGSIGRVGRRMRSGLALALGLLLFSLGLFALALFKSVVGLCQSNTLLAV